MGKLFGLRDGFALNSELDAAQVQWGSEWRMPTSQELNDLCNKCEWTWMEMNGVNGYVVRGKGNYASINIFFPAAGYGDRTSFSGFGSVGRYWSSDPHSDYDDAWGVLFSSGYKDTDNIYRYYGLPVRPVQGFAK